MASTFHGLEIGKRGLFAQQTALNTTGHNIANASTPGYSRQRAEMQASKAIPTAGMHNDRSPSQLGTGVEITKLVRLREEYLDVQIRGENKNLGYWEAKSDTYTKIEELLNEPSETGLAHTMDEFWKGWQELANYPESTSARSVVRQRGIAVAETFKHIMDSLNQIQGDLQNVIQTKTNEVNSLAEQIRSLNDQISRVVPHNYQPNDLYDQRDVLIDQLSKLVNVKVTATQNGMVDISIGNVKLVSGITPPDPLTIDTSTGIVNPADIKIGGNTVTFESGELLGRIESFGTTNGGSESIIPTLKTQINQLATKFATEVNNVHKSGLNLDGMIGGDFFEITPTGDLKVHPDIIKSLNLIAAANEESPGKTSAGNGKNAQDIANIKFKSLTFSEADSTIEDYYRNIIGKLGIDSQESQRMQENSEVIVKQVENRRQSISGVSLDEEMANMIKFQQAYNAAARMVTVMDQCLDKVINGMGRVGL